MNTIPQILIAIGLSVITSVAIQSAETINPCGYENSSTDPNGNPQGSSGLTKPKVETVKPDSLSFKVVILRQVSPPIPNNMGVVADNMQEEPGNCVMDPGSQGYDNVSSNKATLATSSCPRCKQKTLRCLSYGVTITATDPAITISMPTWSNKNEAGAWAQKEWDRFFSALTTHEEGHKALFEGHCAAAKALIDAFAKNKFTGEACNKDATAGFKRARELADAQFDTAKQALDTALDNLATALGTAQGKYDIDTKKGKTQGTVIDGSIPLIGDPPNK